MRSAALIFGLLAGLLGCGVIAFGNLETGLSAVTLLGAHRALIAKFVVYLIPNIGFLGAGMALGKPRLGGFFMLISALGWAGAALLAGHGAVLFAALPFTFVAAGGLVALFARTDSAASDVDGGSSGGGNHWADDPDPGLSEERPRFALQGPGRRRSEPQPGFPDDEPDQPRTPEDRGPTFRQAGPADFDRPSGSGMPAPPRGTMPEAPLLPEQGDAYFPERQPRPASRSEAAMPPGDFALSPEDYSSPPRRNVEPSRRNPYQEFEPYDPDQGSERRGGRLRGIVRVINFILFIGLVGGAAAAVYYDYERGPKSLLFGSHQNTTSPAAVQPQKPTPVPAAVPGPAALPASDNPAAPANAPDNGDGATPAATAPPASTAPPATSDASGNGQPVPLAPPSDAAATPATAPPPVVANATVFNDPGKYCATVDTIDVPDSRFTGAAIPASIAAALQLPASADPTQVHWRCAGRAVYACYSTGAACNMTPTVGLMVAYCAQHPDAQAIPAPNGFWNCNGKRPVIPSDQKWPADARGFYAPAWTRLPDAGNG